MKRQLIFILFIMFVIGMTGCVKEDKISGIKITIGKQDIKYITVNNNENSSLNDKKDTFKYAFESNALKDIQYIKIGEKVTLDFENNIPDKIIIKDILLDSNGNYMYSGKLIADIPCIKQNNKYIFTVDINMASVLSSLMKHIIFRGYKITTYKQ